MTETAVRGATRRDYAGIASVIERAFGADERDLWHYIAGNDPTLDPAGVRVAVLDGRVVACTVVVAREMMTRAGWVRGGIVTLVACDPEYQRRGFGGLTVRSALDYCRDERLSVAVLYGIPDYYPRFGFVPVLPRLTTDLAISDARAAVMRASFGHPSTPETAQLTPFRAADIAAAAALYRETFTSYPLAVKRLETSWSWQYRSGGRRAIGALRDRGGHLIAYGRIEDDRYDRDVASCPEAAGETPGALVPLLGALADKAGEMGFKRLRLVLPPDNRLVQLAVTLGAEQAYRPAVAGMAAVVDWQGILPAGYTLVNGGSQDDRSRPEILRRGEPLLRARRELIVQLAIGYRGFGDLALLPEVEVLAGASGRETATLELPRLYPRWTLAPYW